MFGSKWVEKYVVFQGNTLKIFRSRNDQNPTNQFEIVSLDVVKLTPSEADGKPFAFCLVIGSNSFVFNAKSSELREEWISRVGPNQSPHVPLTCSLPASFPELNGMYAVHPEVMILTCYFNPKKSEYRSKGFSIFYNTIKHMPHRVIELRIGSETPFELAPSPNIKQITSQSLLWHKESLLNNLLRELPSNFKYICWLDGDLLFQNHNWALQTAEKLSSSSTILQLFEWCVHMDRNQLSPSMDLSHEKSIANDLIPNRHVWRSFAANYHDQQHWQSPHYDIHGHVGFAWAARREVLEESGGLYERGLVGGADHIMAHAAVGQIPHNCITKAYLAESEQELINDWSRTFFHQTKGKLGYVEGDIYHIWHGDLKDREYLRRCQEFSPLCQFIVKKDDNGLYLSNNQDVDEYLDRYFHTREPSTNTNKNKNKGSKGSKAIATSSNTNRPNNGQKNIFTRGWGGGGGGGSKGGSKGGGGSRGGGGGGGGWGGGGGGGGGGYYESSCGY